jgi:hypothetical protein
VGSPKIWGVAVADNELNWRRSQRCEAGACVEVAVAEDRVYLRRSDGPESLHLVFSRPAWAAFLAAVCTTEIDG